MTTPLTAVADRAVPGVVQPSVGPSVAPRSMPYPYRAMLAICSDLDETCDLDTYVETLRFLNTTSARRYGKGMGLETGDSIYFDMPAGHVSYWNSDDRGRATIRTLIQSGHIDCLHSFGDLADTRAHAGRALEELDRHGCGLEVWIDHAVAPSNLGADIMRGYGDVPGAAAYHADLSCAFGIHYVWRGRVTSVIGQEVPRRLGRIFRFQHPFASARTVGKEAAKGALARAGNRRYQMHAPNQVLETAVLRDGRIVEEFLRSNPHWGGISCGDTAAGLGDVLDTTAPALIARGACAVLYTHLGKSSDPRRPLTPRTIAALRRLKDLEAAGKLLVTTTRRLLGYRRAVRGVKWSATADGGGVRIDIDTRGTRPVLRRRDLDGLTFYVPNPASAAIAVDGTPLKLIRRNGPDQTGRGSVGVPWTRLEFPAL
ncbi:MAG: hypothetical protein ACRD3G_07115 [Vicinamibacterales bacterium]